MTLRLSKNSTLGFTLLASATMLAGAGALTALTPFAARAARAESASLTSEASRANGAEAETDFQIATRLDASNSNAYIGLARAQVNAGRPEEALNSLERAGEGTEAARLKLKTLLELGRYNQAADAATSLSAPDATSDSDLQLSALAMLLSGRTNYADTLLARIKSADLQSSVRSAEASRLALGHELYAVGLLDSAQAVLVAAPPDFERNLLLARVRYQQHAPADLDKAADLLMAAVAQAPSSISARQLLAKVYTDQNNPAGAAEQADRISHLSSGRP